MSLLTYKLVACLVVFAVAITGVVCACDHGADESCDVSSVATSPCHHGTGEADAHQANDEGHNHDPGQDQDHHDGCTCGTTIVSAPSNQAVAPSLRPALVAHWVTAPLPLALGPTLVHFETFTVAVPHLHRAATSLLRQHCALII
jgi:hypothetical protein